MRGDLNKSPLSTRYCRSARTSKPKPRTTPTVMEFEVDIGPQAKGQGAYGVGNIYPILEAIRAIRSTWADGGRDETRQNSKLSGEAF